MRKRPIKYFMKDGIPMKDKCSKDKICYFSVLKYIGRGMSPDEAFEMAKITKIDPWRFLGKIRYGEESLSRYCRKNNISYCNIYYLITQKMMSVEEAVNYNRKKLDSF